MAEALSPKAVIGFDCATQPNKMGLVLAEYFNGKAQVRDVWRHKTSGPAYEQQILTWMDGCKDGLIAMDAPLGWPVDMGHLLGSHRAGESIHVLADTLFMRLTDREIQSRFKKKPLSVGADKIARTALAALQVLDRLRLLSSKRLPLAWRPSVPGWNVIEVYPAITKQAHGVSKDAVNLQDLPDNVTCPSLIWGSGIHDHTLDAVYCLVAATDFLNNMAKEPDQLQFTQAYKEGWIWAKSG